MHIVKSNRLALVRVPPPPSFDPHRIATFCLTLTGAAAIEKFKLCTWFLESGLGRKKKQIKIDLDAWSIKNGRQVNTPKPCSFECLAFEFYRRQSKRKEKNV